MYYLCIHIIYTLTPILPTPTPILPTPITLGDPQKVVDYINCRLTRLARWKDVLTMSDTGEPDAFDDVCICVVHVYVLRCIYI